MEDRVINPKTKKLIKINGPTYTKLIDEGYTKSYLNSLKKAEDLQLNLVTDKPIEYNDDVMNTIIRYLPLNELFAFYHTNKHFAKLLNNQELLKNLSENFDIKSASSFMDFINQIIKNKYKYDMSTLHDLKDPKSEYVGYRKNTYRWYIQTQISEYKIIYNAYHKGESITSCKTRRTTDTDLCHAKNYLQKHDYASEIDRLSASKNNEDYKKNLNHLEYAIYYKLLLDI